MKSKTIQVSIEASGGMGFIPVLFDPKAVFGKVRAPVRVTINGYTFRSTIGRMGGRTFIPFRRSNQEAARVAAGGRIKVRIAADTAPRIVQVPADLARALQANARLWEQWGKLSYTHQRESVEAVVGAKKPETRVRRIAKVIELVKARARPG